MPGTSPSALLHGLGDRDPTARRDHGLGLPRARRQGGDGRRHRRRAPGRPPRRARWHPSPSSAVMLACHRTRRRVGQHEEARRRAAGRRLAGAVPGGRLGIGRADERARTGRGADRCRRSPHADGHGDAGDDEHHEQRPRATGARGSRGPGVTSVTVSLTTTASAARGTAGRLRVGAPAARSADDGQGEHHPGGQLQEHGQRDERELGEREGGLALGRRPRTGPPSRRPAPRHRVAVHATERSSRPARSRRRGCPPGTAPVAGGAVRERAEHRLPAHHVRRARIGRRRHGQRGGTCRRDRHVRTVLVDLHADARRERPGGRSARAGPR